MHHCILEHFGNARSDVRSGVVSVLWLRAFLFSLLVLALTAHAADNNIASDDILSSQQRRQTDGDTLVVSAGGSFTVGTFYPRRIYQEKPRDVIIGVMRQDVVCWVANHDRPLDDTLSSTLLEVRQDGGEGV
ncbi:hypothetical protein PR202_ga18900 [Eleusine coracana subsp. coracana]|uniref:Uncharacterized protein n=1 Tax=Eleusine coracana subsp. coracana TaxID=191504 RepID=A0AAV5CU12_ELECO|nr:hypothetical protein PR202_ga18900 [Eleusine coracana subsp. coracana]